MPTEFLSDEQEQAYGHYLGPPSTQQLARYFHLDDADRERVNERRGADNKLGFAVQLTTVRFLGTFLAQPTDVPSDVVAYVAAQLGIRDVACLADYAARPTTAWEHAAEIRRIYGDSDFTDPAEGFRQVGGEGYLMMESSMAERSAMAEHDRELQRQGMPPEASGPMAYRDLRYCGCQERPKPGSTIAVN